MSHSTDLFRPIAQEISMTDSFVINVPPVTMSQAGPYDFHILPRGDYYVQMNQIRLYLRMKVVAEPNTDITEADGVGVVNLPGNSLFQAADLYVNGAIISELQNSHLHYKSYLETILSYSPVAGTGPLQASMFQMDEAPHFDDVKRAKAEVTVAGSGTQGSAGYVAPTTIPAVPDSQNDGFISRRAEIAKSQLIDLYIPLHSDFLNAERLLPPGINLTLRLTRAKDNFVLLHPTSTKTFKIVLSDLKLAVPYVGVASSIVAHHSKLALTQPSQLNIKKTEIVVHHYGTGTTNIEIANLFPNRLPKTLILGMVSTAAYNGNTGKNPYNFQHFGVNHVNLTKNGITIPTEPYHPDWEASLFAREYRSFFDNIGIGTNNLGTLINPALYKSGCCLFAFDFAPDKCNGYHCHKKEQGGTLGLTLKFKEATTEAITLILFTVTDAVVSMFKNDVINVKYV